MVLPPKLPAKARTLLKTVTTTFDFDTTVSLFNEFYHFHRKQQLKKIKYNWVLVLAIFFTGAGLLAKEPFFSKMGAAIACALLAFIAYFYWSAQRATQRMAKHLASEKDQLGCNHQFGFDQEKLVYVTNGSRSNVKWDRFKYFNQNGQSVYLFDSRKALSEIISARVIGEEMFKNFMETIQNKDLPTLYKVPKNTKAN